MIVLSVMITDIYQVFIKCQSARYITALDPINLLRWVFDYPYFLDTQRC